MALKQVAFRQDVRGNTHWALNSKAAVMKGRESRGTPNSHRSKKISIQNI